MPLWSLYQPEIFAGGTTTGGGTLPIFSTGKSYAISILLRKAYELEKQAKKKVVAQ